MSMKISFIGLGYVGLPLLIAFAETSARLGLDWNLIGFDINESRINDLNSFVDRTNEVSEDALKNLNGLINFTNNEQCIENSDVFIITVPTPIDSDNKPDLNPLKSASSIVGKSLNRKSSTGFPVVIYESTVYPGATQLVCIPILERESNLKFNQDFSVGYSPERINPGDKSKSVTSIVKVTSGSCPISAEIVDQLYSKVITAGTYRAPSIMVAEAAKIIENIQRDVNIALINELSIIFRALQIDTHDVIEAAATKWNFHKYEPGLVGGHCIGVDPYYLTHRAAQLGYNSKIVLAGRQLNDEMPRVIVQSILYESARQRLILAGEKVLVLGCTFKENCPDIRNSKVFDLIEELVDLECDVTVVDPYADKSISKEQHGVDIHAIIPQTFDFACVIAAVKHDEFLELPSSLWQEFKMSGAYLVDIKGCIIPRQYSDYRV